MTEARERERDCLCKRFVQMCGRVGRAGHPVPPNTVICYHNLSERWPSKVIIVQNLLAVLTILFWEEQCVHEILLFFRIACTHWKMAEASEADFKSNFVEGTHHSSAMILLSTYFSCDFICPSPCREELFSST